MLPHNKTHKRRPYCLKCHFTQIASVCLQANGTKKGKFLNKTQHTGINSLRYPSEMRNHDCLAPCPPVLADGWAEAKRAPFFVPPPGRTAARTVPPGGAGLPPVGCRQPPPSRHDLDPHERLTHSLSWGFLAELRPPLVANAPHSLDRIPSGGGFQLGADLSDVLLYRAAAPLGVISPHRLV